MTPRRLLAFVGCPRPGADRLLRRSAAARRPRPPAAIRPSATVCPTTCAARGRRARGVVPGRPGPERLPADHQSRRHPGLWRQPDDVLVPRRLERAGRRPGPDGRGRAVRPRRGPRDAGHRPRTARSSGPSRTSVGVYVADVDFPTCRSVGRRVHDRSAGCAAPETIRVTFDGPARVDDRRRRRRGARVGHADPGRCRRRRQPSSRPTTSPSSAFYETSIADALAAKEPFVARLRDAEVLRHRPVRADPRPGQAHRRGPPRPDLHQRRALPARGGRRPAPAGPDRRAADPGHGDGRVAAAAEPWIFVVDGDGIVRSSLMLIFGDEELESAIAEVTS